MTDLVGNLHVRSSLIAERFRIVRQLPLPGVVPLYLAEDLKQVRRVYLKVLPSHLAADPLVAERFRREKLIHHRLDHPNILVVDELVEHKGTLAMVAPSMEQSLADRLRERGGRLDAEEALHIVLQALEALDTAHNHGVVHRRLNPEAIYFDEQSILRIGHFGSADVYEMAGLSTHSISLSLPQYMAPELVTSSFVDGRADLYSLAIILWEALAGELPFKGPTPMDFLRQHSEQEAPTLASRGVHVDDRIEQALAIALSADLNNRFVTAQEMREFLRGQIALQRSEEERPFKANCRVCDEPLEPDIGTCLHCACPPLVINDPEGDWTVVLTHPYSTGRDRVRMDTVDEVYGALLRAGGVLRRPDLETDRSIAGHAPLNEEVSTTSIMTLNRPLASGLAERDARQLADFVNAGTNSRFFRAQAQKDRRRQSHILKASQFVERLMVWAFLLGIFATFFLLTFLPVARLLDLEIDDMGGASLEALSFLVLVAFVLLIVNYFRTRTLAPVAGFSRLEDLPGGDFITELVEKNSRLESSRARKLGRNLIANIISLARTIDDDGAVSMQRDRLHPLLESAMEAISELGSFERDRKTENPQRLCRQIQGLSGAHSDELTKRLDDLDTTQRRITRHTTRILNFSSKLAECSTSALTIGATSALTQGLDRLEEAQDALRELSHVGELEAFDGRLSNATTQTDKHGPPAGSWERFRDFQRIGHGAMGTVYRAFDTERGEEVALKIIHPQLRRNPDTKKRLEREVWATRQIAHPRVVANYECIDDGENLFLVMEYHRGQDLGKWLDANGPLDIDQVLDVSRQVLEGLRAAHGRGVVHGDIKPQNLLVHLTGEVDVKIADFGLARIDEASQGQERHTGTPEYMAPEMLSSTVIDGRADLYALAVTLYEALTGELPFEPARPGGPVIRRDEFSEVRTLRPETPAFFARVIEKSLAEDPIDRFWTASQMLEALQATGSESVEKQKTRELVSCRTCQAPLVEGSQRCLECAVEQQPFRRGSHKILLPRQRDKESPGDEDHFLRAPRIHELRRILRTLPGLELSEKFEENVANLPTVLINDLHADDALRLVEILSDNGIEAQVRRTSTPVHLSLFGECRNWPLARIFLWTSLIGPVGLILSFAAPHEDINPIMAMATGLSALLAAAALSLYGSIGKWLPAVTTEEADESSPSEWNVEWADDAAQTFAEVESIRLRQILRRFLQQVGRLRKDYRSADLGEVAIERLDGLVPTFLETLRRVHQLELQVHEIDRPRLIAELSRLEAKREIAVESTDETQTRIDEIMVLSKALREYDAQCVELVRLSEDLFETLAGLAQMGPD